MIPPLTISGPSPVVYTAVRPPSGVGVKAVGVVGVVAFGILVISPWWEMRGLSQLAAAVVVVCFCVGMFGLVMMAARMGPMVRRFAPYRTLSATAAEGRRLSYGAAYRAVDHVGCVLFNTRLPLKAQMLIVWPKSGRYWERLRASADGAGVKLPRTVADEYFWEELSKIRLTSDLLEPEPVISAKTHNYALFGVGILVVAVGAGLVAEEVWRGKGVVATWIVMLVVMSGLFRRFGRYFRMGYGASVAGCGVLKAVDGRRWTSDDAIMVVQQRRLLLPVYVTMIGAAGVHPMTFPSVTDSDFVTLWERWNHLAPKPALLE